MYSKPAPVVSGIQCFIVAPLRDVDGAEAHRRLGRRLRQRRERRHHRLEQRQRQRWCRLRAGTCAGAMLSWLRTFVLLRPGRLRRPYVPALAVLVSRHAHLERRARHDTHDKRREPIILLLRLPDDVAHDRHVVVLEPTPEPINHQLLGQRADEHVRPCHQRSRRATTPSTGVPSASTPDASIGTPASRVRQAPTASKFSSAKPSGSINL